MEFLTAVQIPPHWLNEGMEYCPSKSLPHSRILSPPAQDPASFKNILITGKLQDVVLVPLLLSPGLGLWQ